MKKHPLLSGLVGIVVLLALYLFLWPVAIDPAPWIPPAAPERTGVYAPNNLLSGVQRLESGMGSPLEGVAIDRERRLYAGTKDGRIIRYDREGKNPGVFVEIGGWPLGIAFDAAGHLIVCNGKHGLRSVAPDGTVTTLTVEQGGVPFRNVDGLAIAPDGTIYFTDVSKKFSDDHYMDDLLEHRPNGRLLAYDPATRETRLVLDGLYFPNGVAVAPDNTFLILAEMGMYRLLRIRLTGPRAGTSEVFVDNLPGFPDGLHTGSDGIFWATIVSPRDKLADTVLFPHPTLRKVLRRLPRALMPAPKNYGYVLGVDGNGTIVHNLQDPTGTFGQITNVLEHDGKLYMGSLSEDAVGVIPVPKRAMK
jgi:sugar lactone lactonase YvrE